ncbi:MAG: hypothetical protein V1645_00265 [archaeon]
MGLEDDVGKVPNEGMTRRRFLSFGLLGLVGLSVSRRCDGGDRRFRRHRRRGRWEYDNLPETNGQNVSSYSSQVPVSNAKSYVSALVDVYKRFSFK